LCFSEMVLAAHLVRDEGVAGSNPATPTKNLPQNQQKPNPDRNGATVPGQISGQICAESTRKPPAHARPEVAPRRPINSIRVGTRHRRDLGDIDGLAVSIADVGMLHPIVITPDGMLVAGERRLIACKQLGWTEIAVTIVDLDDIVRGQLAENAIRKDFLPSEIDAIRRALEPIERAAAERRMKAGTPAKVSQGSGRATDKIGVFAGVSGRTVEKIAAVVAAAEADPEKFGRLVEDMDRTGRVDGPHRRLKVMRQAEAIRAEPPPYPNQGPYRVIIADPPWPYELRQQDPSHRGVLPYTSMSIAQICAEADKVRAIAHLDCILWLWTTNHHMREAFAVLDTWGFQQKTILTWVKDKMGMGDWLRGRSEHCLMAVRGKPIVQLTNQTTLLTAPVRAHSQKPFEFYVMVEALCPAPRYADLFSRYRHNGRWDCHGDEIALEAAE
jgi:N6-adenosine-specific RNA methylase IME4/ParB-like chromosome segregation protein Spo0J